MVTLPLLVPHLQQRQPGECLAACAAMVLDYLGIPANYDYLLKLLKINPNVGTPAYNIVELQTLGVDVLYEQGNLALLNTHLQNNHPCIAMVQTRELPYWDGLENSHAVVVTGLVDDTIYLNDPAFTRFPLRVGRGYFELAWLEWDETCAVILPK